MRNTPTRDLRLCDERGLRSTLFLCTASPTSFLDGSGLTTNPVFVQDLALWLPLALVAAVALWEHRPVGHLATASMLTLWTLEGITVATDQWFGHRADPSTEWATTGAVGIFAVLTVVTLIPLLLHLRSVDRTAPVRC